MIKEEVKEDVIKEELGEVLVEEVILHLTNIILTSTRSTLKVHHPSWSASEDLHTLPDTITLPQNCHPGVHHCTTSQTQQVPQIS